ncbi:cytochrome C oxidase Cbb3, partial [Pseudomonas aeruginosa]
MNDKDRRKDTDGYNYDVVRQFTLKTLVCGYNVMGHVVFISAQLVSPALNLDLPCTSFD